MKTKKKAVDLVAFKHGKRFAVEIETGKNSKRQILMNVKKCMENGIDRVYFIPTNREAYQKIRKLLTDEGLNNEDRIILIRPPF